MVPRVSVLVASICRELVDLDVSSDSVRPRQHEQPPDGMPAGANGGTQGSMGTNETATSLPMGSYDPRCATAQITASVAFMSTYRDIIVGILGAFMSFYLGKLSDRVGRVKILVFNGIGILIAEFFLVLVVAFPQYLNYRWLFLSFVVDGLSGSFPLLMATASSYVADSTSDKDRVVAMGWIQSGMFFGMAVGPALSSALSRLSGPENSASIFVYSLLCRVIALFFLLIVPESLPTGEGASFSETGVSLWPKFSVESLPFFNLESHFDPDTDRVELRQKRLNLILLMAINAIMFGTSVGAMDVMMLYPQSKFKWGMMETGNFISIINIFRTVSTVVIAGLMVRLYARSTALKSSNRNNSSKEAHLPILRIALYSDILGYLGFGLSPTGFWFVMSGVLSSLSAMGLSTIQASMSLMVAPAHIGKFMGLLGFLQALTRPISPPIINLIYAWTVSILPQAIFFALTGVLGLGLMLTYFIRAY